MTAHEHGPACTKKGDDLAACFLRIVNERCPEGICHETFVEALTAFIATQFEHLSQAERISLITAIWTRTGALCAQIDSGEAGTMSLNAGLH